MKVEVPNEIEWLTLDCRRRSARKMKIIDAVFVVTDCETTGLDPTKDGVVELGAVATSLERGALGMWATLVRPKIPIPPEASAIHGLTNRDVAYAPAFDAALSAFEAFADRFGRGPYVMHNASFDAAFLGLNEHCCLCTKRLAMKLWPGYPEHRNQSLRYRRSLAAETFGIAPHRALGDALVTAALLRDELTCPEFIALGIDDIDELITYVEQPIIIERYPFGKHVGEPIVGSDPSYMRWMLDNIQDLSRDMRFTLELRLKGVA